VKTVLIIVVVVLLVGGWVAIHAQLRRVSAPVDATGDDEDE
jgi:hypothetical protein